MHVGPLPDDFRHGPDAHVGALARHQPAECEHHLLAVESVLLHQVRVTLSRRETLGVDAIRDQRHLLGAQPHLLGQRVAGERTHGNHLVGRVQIIATLVAMQAAAGRGGYLFTVNVDHQARAQRLLQRNSQPTAGDQFADAYDVDPMAAHQACRGQQNVCVQGNVLEREADNRHCDIGRRRQHPRP